MYSIIGDTFPPGVVLLAKLLFFPALGLVFFLFVALANVVKWVFKKRTTTPAKPPTNPPA